VFHIVDSVSTDSVLLYFHDNTSGIIALLTETCTSTTQREMLCFHGSFGYVKSSVC